MVRRSAGLAHAIAVVVIAASACGAPGPPSGSPIESPTAPSVASAEAMAPLPMACYGLPLDQCREIAASALARLDVSRIAWLEVGPPPCEGEPCPVVLTDGERLDVIAHVDDGQPWHVVVRAADEALIATAPARVELIPLEPDTPSGAAPGAHRFSLGHCGIYSRIDFDGSFWDPVGRVDFTAPAAINSADGTLVLLTASNARFTTPEGFTVDLARHRGTKYFRDCS